MKKQTLKKIVKPIKPILAKTLWREGSVKTILLGPCRGLRYRIFPQMGLSPIYGGWEEDAQALIIKHVPPGSVVYDVGANYGIHVLLFARLVKEQGHVYAFEPVPEILEALRDNLALNKFSNVSCVNLAVSDRAGSTSFVTGHHVGAGHLSSVGDAQGQEVVVRTTTLDDAVFVQNCRPPNFIKMDVEGAEGKALAGAIRVLKDCRPILLVDLHNPEQDVAVGRILAACHYEAFHTENGRKVKDLSKGWPDPNGLWGQFIAFPAELKSGIEPWRDESVN